MNIGDKIYANTPSSGSPLGFNTLFTRLENLRQIHAAAEGQTATLNIFNTAVEKDKIIAITDIQKLNDNLDILKKSSWYISNTAGTITTLESQYTSDFTIPSVGQLITAGNFNTLDNELTVLEGICPVYSGKYSGQYSGQYGSRYGSKYGTQYSGRYGTQYSGRYGTRYGTQYSGRYGTQYSGRYGTQYSGRYGTRYGTKYGSKYGTQYSGRYGTKYGTKYGSKYGTQYSGRYGTRYGTKYGSQYSGKYGTRYSGKYSSQYSGKTRRGRN